MTDTADKELTLEHNPSMKPALVADLVGPFLVHFVDDIVRVHAPMCTDHHANILTDHDDISLHGILADCQTYCSSTSHPPQTGYVYALTGPVGNPGPCAGLDGSHQQCLVLKSSKQKITVKNETFCHLVFELPKPDQIFPLIPEQIFIHKNDAPIWLDPSSPKKPVTKSGEAETGDYFSGSYARALRFVYLNCPAKPQVEVQRFGNEKPPAGFLDELNKGDGFDTVGFDSPKYYFTLRFASNSTTPDNNHQDAYNCFQTMRQLIPETLQWRVDFDNAYLSSTMIKKATRSPHNLNLFMHGGPNPVDCNAAVLVVQS